MQLRENVIGMIQMTFQCEAFIAFFPHSEMTGHLYNVQFWFCCGWLPTRHPRLGAGEVVIRVGPPEEPMW